MRVVTMLHAYSHSPRDLAGSQLITHLLFIATLRRPGPRCFNLLERRMVDAPIREVGERGLRPPGEPHWPEPTRRATSLLMRPSSRGIRPGCRGEIVQWSAGPQPARRAKSVSAVDGQTRAA